MDFYRKINSEKYSSDELPTYPARTLVVHVGVKGVQIGSAAGLVLGVQLLTYLRKMPVGKAWRNVMPVAPIIGSVLTLTMLYAKHYNTPMDIDGVDDRAFRIMHNNGQVKIDRYSVLGAAAGAAIGTVVMPGLRSALAGSSTGVVFGMLFYVAESRGLLEKLRKMT